MARAKWIMPCRLKRARVLAGLSQYELARIMRVTQPTISHWERRKGGQIPSITNLILLCQELNASADYLLGLTESPKRDGS